MSAAEALKTARASGVDLHLDGDELMLEAAAPPPNAILELLSRHKPGIAMLLRPGRDGWTAEDWQVFFDERAGIAAFGDAWPRRAWISLMVSQLTWRCSATALMVMCRDRSRA